MTEICVLKVEIILIIGQKTTNKETNEKGVRVTEKESKASSV